ncbi:uncharacterized protein LOC144450639 [Glandiceps talaboti]
MSKGSREVTAQQNTKVEPSASSSSSSVKTTTRVEIQLGTNREPIKLDTMQDNNPQMASIAENLNEDCSQSSSSHSNGGQVANTSAPIAIPSFGTQSSSPMIAVSSMGSPQSFRIRQFSSSPSLSTCYWCGSSSPKSQQTASTQTPAESQQLERQRSLEIDDSSQDEEDIETDSDDDTYDDAIQVVVPGNGNRWRSRSESDGNRSRSNPLPDLLEFRNRSHSEPADVRPEIEVGRELRRISDEFHLSYQESRVIRRAASSHTDRPSFFWEMVSTIRRRASFSRGSSV